MRSLGLTAAASPHSEQRSTVSFASIRTHPARAVGLIYAAEAAVPIPAAPIAGVNDRVPLGIERDDSDGLPVPRVSRPAPGIGFTSPDRELVPAGQDVAILVYVTLSGTHVAVGTVAVLVVVQIDNRKPTLPSPELSSTDGILGMAARCGCWGSIPSEAGQWCDARLSWIAKGGSPKYRPGCSTGLPVAE